MASQSKQRKYRKQEKPSERLRKILQNSIKVLFKKIEQKARKSSWEIKNRIAKIKIQ